jgi:hypothetical protein
MNRFFGDTLLERGGESTGGVKRGCFSTYERIVANDILARISQTEICLSLSIGVDWKLPIYLANAKTQGADVKGKFSHKT